MVRSAQLPSFTVSGQCFQGQPTTVPGKGWSTAGLKLALKGRLQLEDFP